ncbi:Thioredoxin H1-like isoform 1 [Oopsacas minuta]|uniref:Thioredoxin H1-like isoform 1 n=1 Tax=Oopsacas minuta TaxID=111878 RepID=A0AAV7K0C0_9METZ|nr:Thioredoxin H1-like isoform 1 [Oopsacas minuta]
MNILPYRVCTLFSGSISFSFRRFMTYKLNTGEPTFEHFKIDTDVFVGKKSLISPTGDLPSPRRPCFRSLPDLNDNPFGFKRGEVLEVDDWETAVRIVNFKSFKDTLVGVNVYAEWCEQCNWLNRYWDKWAAEFPDSVFLNCDVEKDSLFYKQYKARAVPTILLYREFIMLQKIEGAYEKRIFQLVEIISTDILPVRGEVEFFKYHCSDQYYNGNEPDYY